MERNKARNVFNWRIHCFIGSFACFPSELIILEQGGQIEDMMLCLFVLPPVSLPTTNIPPCLSFLCFSTSPFFLSRLSPFTLSLS